MDDERKRLKTTVKLKCVKVYTCNVRSFFLFVCLFGGFFYKNLIKVMSVYDDIMIH